MSDPFNLIDRPWIPCIALDAARVELGLRDVLARAHKLREVSGDTPLETAALHRLLLVVLHRVFGPATINEWEALWDRRAGGFDTRKLEEYWHAWYHKFNLLDPKCPLFQVGDQSHLGQVDTVNKMITQLTMDATLFQHTLNDEKRGAVLTTAQAARALVAIQCYGLGYKQFVDAPCTKGIAFIVHGDTLLETLVLNMICYPLEQRDWNSTEDDAPAWEHENPFRPTVQGMVLSRDARSVDRGQQKLQYDEQDPLGYLDYLTWQNRKIKLVCPDGQTVREMAWAPGLRLKNNVRDPMQSYKQVKDGWRPVCLSPERAVWRDVDTLLKLTPEDEKKARPVAALAHLALVIRMRPQTSLPRAFRLKAYGLAKNQARLEFMRSETTPLRIEYLARDDLAPQVGQALGLAEQLGQHLIRCAFLLAWLIYNPRTKDQEFQRTPGADTQSEDPIDNKMKAGTNKKGRDREAPKMLELFSSFGVERVYWSSLETHFYRFVRMLPEQPDQAARDWRKQLERAARTAFAQAQAYAGADRRTLRAVAQAEERFESGLKRIARVPARLEGGESDDRN